MNDSDKKMVKSVEFEPLKLLKRFKDLIDKRKELTFLKKNYDKINPHIDKLISEFEIAQDEAKKNGNKKGISEILDWHDVHESARELWQVLMSSAINFIDPSSKGNQKLFEYLEESSKFEDVLYGLEDYYRDHTLHSIWVYLMGVELMCEDGILSNISNNLNWYLFNDIEAEKDKYPYPDILKYWAKIRESIFMKQLHHYKDASWCVMALCHDLGYSLAKLGELNKRVASVLSYFNLQEFRRVGYNLEIEHQYLLEQFLEIMAMDVRIVPGENYQDLEKDTWKTHYPNPTNFVKELEELEIDLKVKSNDFEKLNELIENEDIVKLKIVEKILQNYKIYEPGDVEDDIEQTKQDIIKDIEEQTLVKCYRDDSTYWRLCKAFERNEHGILSAYLIYKTLGIFADTSIRGSSEEWGLTDQEIIFNVIRGDILFAIAQHEFAYTHINQLSSLAEILILCDELEEFTRLGRKMLSRKYTDTTAETGLKIIELEADEDVERIKGNPLSLELIYKSKHKEIKDFHHFVWRKMKRVCTLYSLVQVKDHSEIISFPINELSVSFEYEIVKDKNADKKFDSPVTGKSATRNRCKRLDYYFTMKIVEDELIFTSVLKQFVVRSSKTPTKNLVLECVDDSIEILEGEQDIRTLKELLKVKDKN